jgi:hypothetical protein
MCEDAFAAALAEEEKDLAVALVQKGRELDVASSLGRPGVRVVFSSGETDKPFMEATL